MSLNTLPPPPHADADISRYAAIRRAAAMPAAMLPPAIFMPLPAAASCYGCFSLLLHFLILRYFRHRCRLRHAMLMPVLLRYV